MICWRLTKSKNHIIHSYQDGETTLCGKELTEGWQLSEAKKRVSCSKCKEALEEKEVRKIIFSEEAQKNLNDFEYYLSLFRKMNSKGSKSLSLAEHAEMWWLEQGNSLPDKGSIEWKKMYEEWIRFAFEKGD